MTRCSKCGLETDSVFCPACGARVLSLEAKQAKEDAYAKKMILDHIDEIETPTLMNIGISYYRGKDVRRDMEIAEKAFTALSLRGEVSSMFYLAQLLLEKRPQPRDRALSWLVMAAERGHEGARILLSDLGEKRIADRIAASVEMKKKESNLEKLTERAMPSVLKIYVSYGAAGLEIGSGFILKGGWVLTNSHVVSGYPEQIAAMFDPGVDDQPYSLEVLYVDDRYDIAVLTFQDPMRARILLDEMRGNREALTLRSEEVSLGEKVYTIGNPLDLGLSVSQGIVSNPKCTKYSYGSWDSVIQTDMTTQYGSSGGVLLDMQNRVVGMLAYSPKICVGGQSELSLSAGGLATFVPAVYIEQAIKKIRLR